MMYVHIFAAMLFVIGRSTTMDDQPYINLPDRASAACRRRRPPVKMRNNLNRNKNLVIWVG